MADGCLVLCYNGGWLFGSKLLRREVAWFGAAAVDAVLVSWRLDFRFRAAMADRVLVSCRNDGWIFCLNIRTSFDYSLSRNNG